MAVLLGNSVLQILVGLIVGVEQSLVSVGVGILLQSSDAANSSSQISSLGIVTDVQSGDSTVSILLDVGNNSAAGSILGQSANQVLQGGDGLIHRRGVIGVRLNPGSNLSQSIQRLLGALGDQLGSQLLIGNGAGRLAGISTNQSGQLAIGGVQISLVSLAVDLGLQGSLQLGLAHLILRCQSAQISNVAGNLCDLSIGVVLHGLAGRNSGVVSASTDRGGVALDYDSPDRAVVNLANTGISVDIQHALCGSSRLTRSIGVQTYALSILLITEVQLASVVGQVEAISVADGRQASLITMVHKFVVLSHSDSSFLLTYCGLVYL